MLVAGCWMLDNLNLKFDGFLKSHQSRHSRASGSPEPADFTGFLLSQE
jgi:hypothetical protein